MKHTKRVGILCGTFRNQNPTPTYRNSKDTPSVSSTGKLRRFLVYGSFLRFLPDSRYGHFLLAPLTSVVTSLTLLFPSTSPRLPVFLSRGLTLTPGPALRAPSLPIRRLTFTHQSCTCTPDSVLYPEPLLPVSLSPHSCPSSNDQESDDRRLSGPARAVWWHSPLDRVLLPLL